MAVMNHDIAHTHGSHTCPMLDRDRSNSLLQFTNKSVGKG